jgi:predicted RNA-binding protein associated with RNAse of E/G family
MGDGVFVGLSMLLLTRPGAGHAFMPFWSDGGEFAAWYVNIQTPLRRTRWGFDTEDLVLDVVFQDGLVRWKDEDELAEAVELGRFTSERALEIRREADRAAAALEAGEWPLNAGWESWRADPAWPPAMLPADDAYLR